MFCLLCVPTMHVSVRLSVLQTGEGQRALQPSGKARVQQQTVGQRRSAEKGQLGRRSKREQGSAAGNQSVCVCPVRACVHACVCACMRACVRLGCVASVWGDDEVAQLVECRTQDSMTSVTRVPTPSGAQKFVFFSE